MNDTQAAIVNNEWLRLWQEDPDAFKAIEHEAEVYGDKIYTSDYGSRCVAFFHVLAKKLGFE